MGSKGLILDHHILHQLWRDPIFWEIATQWSNYREEAEVEVAADALQSSISIKRSELYNEWMKKIEHLALRGDPAVRELVAYIRRQRNFKYENILLAPFGARKHLLTLFEAR